MPDAEQPEDQDSTFVKALIAWLGSERPKWTQNEEVTEQRAG